MKTRVITAIIALAIFIPIIILGGNWVVAAAVLLSGIAAAEILVMRKILLVNFEALLMIISTALLTLPDTFWQGAPFWLTRMNILYLFALLLLARTVFTRNKFSFNDAGVLVLGALYIGTGFHYFVAARDSGLVTLMFGLLIVWLTDSFAYIVGRQFGKHKIAPKVSPKKTIEGSVGGSLIATAIMIPYVIWTHFQPNGMSVGLVIFVAFLLSIAGQIGDLIESSLKRHYHVKDSGKILPGHGGILDRFDSMLIVLPLMFLFNLL